MVPKPSRQDRLDALTKICLALPETRREDKGSHCAFLVSKKTFAYYLNNHHGDNIISVCCKVLPGENTFLVESNPDRFYLPAYIGPRGWIALRMDLPKLNWSEVKELILGSYLQLAPKRLGSRFVSGHDFSRAVKAPQKPGL
jgi:phosphoribosylglycinamide formyltransferase-1